MNPKRDDGRISADLPVFEPILKIPCRSPCELIFWSAVDEMDIEILSARRCTLRLSDPKFLPSPNPSPFASQGQGDATLPVSTQYDGIKAGSCIDLDIDTLSRNITRQLKERFLRQPGELMNPDNCQSPCQCVPDRDKPWRAAGVGEAVTDVWIDFDETVATGDSHRGERRAHEPPPLDQILDSDGNPVPFDPETDDLKLSGLGGPHGSWQIWSVVRRYRAVLRCRIKHQITIQEGTCKEIIGPF